MTSHARLIASSAESPSLSAEPGCSTTPAAPSSAPALSATFSDASDFTRISGSSEAQLSRYTAWMTSASTT